MDFPDHAHDDVMRRWDKQDPAPTRSPAIYKSKQTWLVEKLLLASGQSEQRRWGRTSWAEVGDEGLDNFKLAIGRVTWSFEFFTLSEISFSVLHFGTEGVHSSIFGCMNTM